MATVFVDFASPEDILTELVQAVSKDEKFVEDSQAQIQEGKSAELLSKLAADVSSPLSLPEKDAESILLAALSMIKKLPADAQEDVASKLAASLTSAVDDKPQFRLKMLNHAYNVLNGVPAVRFALFRVILKFAISSHTEDAVANVHADLERLSKAWNASDNELREVYRLIRDIFRNRKQAKEAHEWTLKFLSFFKDEADVALASTTDEAIGCVISAINLVGLYSFDALTELLPVKRLEQANPNAWKLLNVFVSGTLEDYLGLKPHMEQFKAAGLNEQSAESKIRCLTLATLGSQSGQVPYAAVASALQVDESQIEPYVVKAISDGVMDARLDQLRRQINVVRTIQRQFGRAQWVQLNETLQAWKTNVKAILQSIEVVNPAAQAIAQH